MRQDNTGRTPNIGDRVTFNPPYYKGLLIGEVTGEKKGSGLPTIDVNGKEYTPKTGFVVIPELSLEDVHKLTMCRVKKNHTGRWGLLVGYHSATFVFMDECKDKVLQHVKDNYKTYFK